MKNPMEITRKIDEIISSRKGRKPLVEKHIQDLEAAIAAAGKLQAMKDSVVGKDGKLNPESPYYGIFADNIKMQGALLGFSSAAFMEDAEKLLVKYRDLDIRFQRDFINIAVVGPARQGKSRLLQSVTGLDSRCIPAFDGDHCTGASSIIENGDNDHVRVCLTYKTEDDILQEAQGYLDTISGKTEKIYRMDDLPGYTLERLNQILKDAINTGNIKEESIAQGKLEIFYIRYIRHYSEWRDLIGRVPEWKTDEDEIMTYVAQHNGKKRSDPERRQFFKFVAVKSARIIKAFSHEDAGKIKLLDTVGLGDIADDTEKKMLSTIKSDSDAVIFFRFPDPHTGGSPTIDERKIFSLIMEEFRNKKMEKWFAFLINHSLEYVDPEDSSNNRLDNMDTCKDYKNALDGSALTFPTIMNQIVNVADPDEVREDFLDPLLQALIENLPEIDQMYLDEIIPDANRVWVEYDALCRSVENLIKFSMGVNDAYEVRKLFESIYDGVITARLRKKNLEYSERRNEKCLVLQERIQAITDHLNDLLPSAETIQEYIDTHGKASVQEVYKHYLDILRSQITQRFIEIDTSISPLIVDFKNELAKILIEDGRLGKIMPLPGRREPYEWLKDFADAYLEGYEQLARSFRFLYQFDFTVRGTLMYRVRTCLAEISHIHNNNVIPDRFKTHTGKSVYFHLTTHAMNGVADKLKATMSEFYIFPNEAMFAVRDEFYDRAATSEGVEDEWFRLYSSFSGRVWSKELLAAQQTGQATAAWAGEIEELQKYNRKDSFVLSLG